VSAGEAVPVCLTFDVDADQSWRVRRPGEQPTTEDPRVRLARCVDVARTVAVAA
jgi:hypothetical protein